MVPRNVMSLAGLALPGRAEVENLVADSAMPSALTTKQCPMLKELCYSLPSDKPSLHTDKKNVEIYCNIYACSSLRAANATSLSTRNVELLLFPTTKAAMASPMLPLRCASDEISWPGLAISALLR